MRKLAMVLASTVALTAGAVGSAKAFNYGYGPGFGFSIGFGAPAWDSYAYAGYPIYHSGYVPARSYYYGRGWRGAYAYGPGAYAPSFRHGYYGYGRGWRNSYAYSPAPYRSGVRVYVGAPPTYFAGYRGYNGYPGYRWGW
jgi:hypothetical protein